MLELVEQVPCACNLSIERVGLLVQQTVVLAALLAKWATPFPLCDNSAAPSPAFRKLLGSAAAATHAADAVDAADAADAAGSANAADAADAAYAADAADADLSQKWLMKTT